MVTKALLDYLQLEYGKGLPYEKVKDALLRQGWRLEDIESGHRLIEERNKKSKILPSISQNPITTKQTTTPTIQNNIASAQQAKPVTPTQQKTSTEPLPQKPTTQTVTPKQTFSEPTQTWERARTNYTGLRIFGIILFGIIVGIIAYLRHNGSLTILDSLISKF